MKVDKILKIEKKNQHLFTRSEGIPQVDDITMRHDDVIGEPTKSTNWFVPDSEYKQFCHDFALCIVALAAHVKN